MTALSVTFSLRHNAIRRALGLSSVNNCLCDLSDLRGHRTRMFSNRCAILKTTPVSWRMGSVKSYVGCTSVFNTICSRPQAAFSLFLITGDICKPSTNNFRRCYGSARPMRDVDPVQVQQVDTSTEEVCLTSGKSIKLCSCSCCAEKRAWNDVVQSSSACHRKVYASSDEIVGITNQDSVVEQQNADQATELQATVEKPGLLKRFKMMYKQYGIVMICVHWSLASVWTGAFYYAAISGVNVVPVLKWFGASDAVISPFLRPTVGHAAVTYLLYKLATPLRYAVTIAATQLTVKYLRQWGYMKPPKPDDSLRSLVSDGRTKVKGKMDEVRDKVEDKMDEVRDRIETVRDKVEDKMDEVRDRIETVRDKVEDKMDEVRDRIETVRDKVEDKMGEVRDRIETVRDKVEDKLDNIRDDAHELKGKLDHIRCQKSINSTIIDSIKSPVQHSKKK